MIFYNFPEIHCLSDVLPYLKGREEFLVIDKGLYKVIDYVYTTEDTFPPYTGINRSEIMDYDGDEFEAYQAKILRECRGLMFDAQGQIIARRFHKFFNVNEREETLAHTLDFDPSDWLVMEKLDGSMITPFITGSWTDHRTLRWGTKKGETEVSAPVVDFVAKNPNYIKFAWFCDYNRLTPIFEWCSRKQRIVVDHPKDRLVLTGLRWTVNGAYFSYDNMRALAEEFKIDVVQAQPAWNLKEVMEQAKDWEDHEGFVLRHHSGHMLKVKSDWYLQIHNTKEIIATESKVMNLILQNAVDDVMPLLVMDVDRQRVRNYERAFNKWLDGAAKIFHTMVEDVRSCLSRKQFALSTDAGTVRSLMFAMWETTSIEEIHEILKKYISKNLTPRIKFDTMKYELDMKFEYGTKE